MTKVYRIQRDDGLFSTGGVHPIFTKEGKYWRTKAHIKAHFNIMTNRYSKKFTIKDFYENCTIVEYELTETTRINIEDL